MRATERRNHSNQRTQSIFRSRQRGQAR